MFNGHLDYDFIFMLLFFDFLNDFLGPYRIIPFLLFSWTISLRISYIDTPHFSPSHSRFLLFLFSPQTADSLVSSWEEDDERVSAPGHSESDRS